jgi:hypothetical protein
MKRLIALVVASSLLISCSHDLTLVGRDTGLKGSGVSTGWNGSGTITAELNNKTYTGDWVMAGSSIDGPATGTALLKSEDGSRLHCDFTFSYTVGYGTCEDKKETYDLQIH